MRLVLTNTLLTMLCAVVLLDVATLPALADTPSQTSAGTVTITGSVVDRDGSIPVSGATVELVQDTVTVVATKADQFGAFTLPGVKPGTYVIVVRAQGYGTVRSDAIQVTNATVNLSLIMQRTQTAGAIRTIGRVVVSTHAAGLQTTTTIQSVADPRLAQRTNQIRMAESLGKLPEVNLVGLDSSVGDDISVDIRGLKPSESQVLLDGHPIGPLGVYPGSIGGGVGGFNFQDSPLFATESTLVTYGSGATGLYGVDAVGGSIDMQTLNPTLRPAGELQYGFAEQGKQVFGVQATGTSDKLGYAMAYGVTGTYGDFPRQIISQTGLRGTNWTSAKLAGSTYEVTGDYMLRNFLGKMRYSFSPSTSLILTGYSATSLDDKTGNGDNDFISPEFATFQAQSNSNCATSTGAAGITVTTDTGSTCLTPQQYGQGASGPAGGGPGAFQALGNQDYHARLLTVLGKNQLVVDGFIDNFSQNRQRSASFVNGPDAVLTNIYHTIGTLISDSITGNKNDFGFGYYQQRQYTNGNSINGSASPPFIPHSALLSKLQSVFVRDAYTPTQQLSFFLNAWEKKSLIGGWSFDPRLSIVYRPEPADVIRLTGGGASADPAPIAVDLTGPGGINPGNCQQFSLGTVPSSGVLPEKSTDIEGSFAHRWVADTITQFTLYDTNERNTIFEGQDPAANHTDVINQFGGPNYLAAAIAHVTSVCPNFTASNPATIANFFINSNLNLATSRARGFELSQRLRVNPHLFFDGYWNTQSTTIFDSPATLLMNNPTLIPGSQLPRIPLHKWSLAGNLTTTRGGELYLDYVQVDSNNELNRVSYGSASFALTQQVANHTFVNIGVSNIFNQAVDNYGRIGLGRFVPENQFGIDSNGVNQGSERFGLAPAAISFSVIQRY
ncbi:MAG TPA: TonB-dependent receptor [Candidatus Acidoferrales bacterium]|nr:TonB-dependent receptor [Candidatus Acidoferrales bacterium]